MGLIARYSAADAGQAEDEPRAAHRPDRSPTPSSWTSATTIADYIGTLKAGEGLSEKAIREGYQRFKAEKNASELAAIAGKHGLATAALQAFVDGILDRMIFDGEQLTDLLDPART